MSAPPNLLHLDASARKKSLSREVGRVFAEAWLAAHPGGVRVHRDLLATPPPFIDEARTEIVEYASANGLRGLDKIEQAVRTPEQRASWSVAKLLIDELVAADTLLVTTPFYNFSIPAVLKAWIDQVTFPWLPIARLQVVVATARGNTYRPGSPRAHFDFQEPFLKAYFELFGIKDLHFIHTEFTAALFVPAAAANKDKHESSRAEAIAEARVLAARAIPPR